MDIRYNNLDFNSPVELIKRFKSINASSLAFIYPIIVDSSIKNDPIEAILKEFIITKFISNIKSNNLADLTAKALNFNNANVKSSIVDNYYGGHTIQELLKENFEVIMSELKLNPEYQRFNIAGTILNTDTGLAIPSFIGLQTYVSHTYFNYWMILIMLSQQKNFDNISDVLKIAETISNDLAVGAIDEIKKISSRQLLEKLARYQDLNKYSTLDIDIKTPLSKYKKIWRYVLAPDMWDDEVLLNNKTESINYVLYNEMDKAKYINKSISAFNNYLASSLIKLISIPAAMLFDQTDFKKSRNLIASINTITEGIVSKMKALYIEMHNIFLYSNSEGVSTTIDSETNYKRAELDKKFKSIFRTIEAVCEKKEKNTDTIDNLNNSIVQILHSFNETSNQFEYFYSFSNAIQPPGVPPAAPPQIDKERAAYLISKYLNLIYEQQPSALLIKNQAVNDLVDVYSLMINLNTDIDISKTINKFQLEIQNLIWETLQSFVANDNNILEPLIDIFRFMKNTAAPAPAPAVAPPPPPPTLEEAKRYFKHMTYTIANLTSNLIMAFGLIVHMNSFCELSRMVKEKVELKSIDVMDFPNFTYIIPVEIIKRAYYFFAYEKTSAHIRNTYLEVGARSGNNEKLTYKKEDYAEFKRFEVNETNVHKMINIISKMLKVPNLVVFDYESKDVYYKFMFNNSVNKVNIKAIQNYTANIRTIIKIK